MQDSDRNLDWLSHDFWNKGNHYRSGGVRSSCSCAHRLPQNLFLLGNALVVNISLNQHFIFKLQTSLIG